MKDDKTKILLIEDDAFLLSMYAAKFRLEKFKIIAANNGEKGLELAKKELPDVILLDIMLPEINGFEVLREIKNNKELRETMVILLTNLSQKEEIEKGLAMGADDFLVKAHFTPSEVVEKIKQKLKSQETAT